MGEIAEMMLDGTLCAGCGEELHRGSPGYPQHCSEQCERNTGAISSEPTEVVCKICSKHFRLRSSLVHHLQDKHRIRFTASWPSIILPMR
jgi:hypothetical protein